jgi:hypothetical protein
VKRAALLLSLGLLAACATTAPVDMKEARRVVGTENDVRVDAEIFGDTLTRNSNIALKYDITNNRPQPILVADLLPNATYDEETQTVTVELGAEIPGEAFLPRLIPIGSGEKKSFSAAARILIAPHADASPWVPRPRALRLKLNFLGGAGAPFEKLIAIPEKAVHDPQLAAELFQKWVDQNESVTTNALPMRWANAAETGGADASVPAGRRRGGT